MSTTSTSSTISPCFKGCFECGKTGKKNFDGGAWKQRFEEEASVKCKECVKTEQQYQARTVCLLEDENIISLILSILNGICQHTLILVIPGVSKWWRYVCKTNLLIDVNVMLLYGIKINYCENQGILSIMNKFKGIKSANLEYCRFLSKTNLSKLIVPLQEFTISNSDIDDELLSSILKASSLSLKKLKLSNCKNLTNQSLIEIVNCKRLESVALCYFEIDNSVFEEILTSCNHLKIVDFTKCRNLRLTTFTETKLPNLESLTLTQSRRISEIGYKNILLASPNLCFLNINNCNLIDELFLVGKYCRKLNCLLAGYNFHINDKHIIALTKNCKMLAILNIGKDICSPEVLYDMKKEIPGICIIHV